MVGVAATPLPRVDLGSYEHASIHPPPDYHTRIGRWKWQSPFGKHEQKRMHKAHFFSLIKIPTLRIQNVTLSLGAIEEGEGEESSQHWQKWIRK